MGRRPELSCRHEGGTGVGKRGLRFFAGARQLVDRFVPFVRLVVSWLIGWLSDHLWLVPTSI